MNIQTRSLRYQSSRGTILATSREIFLRHGYIDASMDTIAHRSGVSKTTLYAHFESKEALFNQVVVDVVSERDGDAVRRFDTIPGESLRDKLIAIANLALEEMLDPEAIALLRLCAIEGARMPRLCYEALTAARENLLRSVIGFLRDHADGAQLVISDFREAADLFLVLLLRDYRLEAMLPWSEEGPGEGRRHNAEQVADLMLRFYGRPAAG